MPHELFQVVLHHTVQGHQIAVDVVKHFAWRGLWAQEIERPAACENFDAAFVGWEQGDKAIGQAAFAAHSRDDG